MLARLFVAIQYLLPQHALSRLVGWLAGLESRPLKTLLIGGFMRLYRVDLAEAADPDPHAYPSFNAFFTRGLAEAVRPQPADLAVVSSPVDGGVSLSGRLDRGRLLQAKGFRYDLVSLLGGDCPEALARGWFATLYLAPWNYHRIHAPATGQLREMRYLPGRLFSVNGLTVSALPRLFSRNERVACLFETALGPIAVVLVGALNVGSIETTWAGRVAPGPDRKPATWRYPASGEGAVRLARGAELGRFNLGSTVIVVLPEHATLAPDIVSGAAVRVGQTLAWPARQPA